MSNKLLKVELIAHTPNPEAVIASSAKLCYSPVGVCEIMEKQTDEQVEKFLKMLMSMGHESPIEHVSFTFGIEGVSRIVETQLVRHRIASYSIQSGRYVKRDNPDFVIPDMIENDHMALALFDEAMENAVYAYNQLVECLMWKQIDDWYNKNKELELEYNSLDTLDEFKNLHKKEYGKFEKIAIENARYVYPQSLATKIVVTMNARTLMNFMKHRTCHRAQDEIQELAWAMLEKVNEVAPTLAKYMGASCLVKNKCSEGAMCCGKPIKEHKWNKGE